jgi:hypothetical protein
MRFRKKGSDLSSLVHARDNWRAVVNTVINADSSPLAFNTVTWEMFTGDVVFWRNLELLYVPLRKLQVDIFSR